MPTLTTGAFITVRGEDYLVHKIERKSDDTNLIHAEGASELVKGFHFIFDESLEQEIRVRDARETRLVADNTNAWQKTRLHLETQIRNAAVDSNQIVIGHKAAIEPAPYQFDPVIKALDLPRPRILIADGVGLGKTIETGIFLAEMIKRGKGQRILVLALKSILSQFQQEIWSRFSIPLVKLDSQGIARIKAELPANKNPFDYYDKTIISIDTLKNNAKFRHYIEKSHWDIIVIDECHTVANASSQRGDLAGFMAGRCESLVLTSATPHNGKKESFANLIRMIEPTAIPRRGDFTKEDVGPYYVRRFKKHIEDSVRDSFREREIRSIRTDLTTEEEYFLEFQQQMKHKARGKNNRHDVLFSIGLLKGYLSSPEACLQSLENRKKRILAKQNGTQPTVQSPKSIRNTEIMQNPEEVYETGDHKEHLEELDEAISRLRSVIAAGADSKFNRLIRHFEEEKWQGRKKDDRYLIFAERVETVHSLARKLKAHYGLSDESVVTFDGGLADMEQQQIIDDFGKADSDIRLLISTDAGSQGVNLHYYCHKMINYDIPWSIITLDQRNGRIDRFGQKQTPIIHYLITDSKNDRLKTDLYIIEKLVEKEDVVHRTLGDAQSVMKLYKPEAEESRVADAIAESDPDFMEELENFNFDTIFENDDDTTDIEADVSTIVENTSLFRDDYHFYDSLTRYLQSRNMMVDNELELNSQDRMISFLNTANTSQFLYDIPEEAKPAKGRYFELTTDDRRVQQAIDEARKRKGEWPRFQKLYDLHPLARFWMSKLEAHVDKDVSTVVRLPILPPDTFHFVFQGIVSNNLGQPLLSRFIVTPLDIDGALADSIEEIDVFIKRYDLSSFDTNSVVSQDDIELLNTLLPEAVDMSNELYINSRKNELQDEMLQKLEAYEKHLREWKTEAEEQLELAFGETTSGVRAERKKHQLNEIQDITDSKSQYFQDMCALDNPAHLKLVTVFYNRSV